MEGSTRPIDWGLRFITGQDKNSQCLHLAEILLALYRPTFLVVEDWPGSRLKKASPDRAVD